MSKRKYLDMSNTIPHRKKKKERTLVSVTPPIQLTDLNSLISIAQYSKNANVTYPNINNKTLQIYYLN